MLSNKCRIYIFTSFWEENGVKKSEKYKFKIDSTKQKMPFVIIKVNTNNINIYHYKVNNKESKTLLI